LEFLGRTDFQLKINGYRVEAGEVEAALAAHPAVRQAVVVPVGERGGYRLHAFVATDDETLSQAELQTFLLDRLPFYARPSGLTLLERLPLTANGKVDRGALRPPPSGTAENEPGAEAPLSAVEKVLAEVWGDLLGRPDVPRNATFFALGGDSLQATRLVQRLRERFGCELSLRQLLSEPTVAGLATLIEHQHLDFEVEYTEDGAL
jgi:acyl carrier protein